jgi:alkylhydroperoxidase family enzyme
MNVAKPRIAPGTRDEIGRLNAVIAAGIGRAAGTGPPNIFTTLARHRSLFRPWLRFAGALMPRGSLPRADSELLILRVAHNSDCEYEWSHHQRLGAAAGLSTDDVQRVRDGFQAHGWTPRQALLLQAADELHQHREISDPLWDRLRERLTDVELIEMCMLVGHYEMLAMTLNSLRVQPDSFASARPSRLAGLLGRRTR